MITLCTPQSCWQYASRRSCAIGMSMSDRELAIRPGMLLPPIRLCESRHTQVPLDIRESCVGFVHYRCANVVAQLRIYRRMLVSARVLGHEQVPVGAGESCAYRCELTVWYPRGSAIRCLSVQLARQLQRSLHCLEEECLHFTPRNQEVVGGDIWLKAQEKGR